MKYRARSIEERVEQGLRRLGLEKARVVHHGNGNIVLVFSTFNYDDRAIAMAVAKTVPGVTAVSAQNA